MSELQLGFINLRRLLGEKKKEMSNIRKKTKENVEIINHLHEIYSNICKEFEATINKQGIKRNIRTWAFLFLIEG